MAEEKELKVASEAKEEKAPAEAPKEARGPRGDRKDRRNKGERRDRRPEKVDDGFEICLCGGEFRRSVRVAAEVELTSFLPRDAVGKECEPGGFLVHAKGCVRICIF